MNPTSVLRLLAAALALGVLVSARAAAPDDPWARENIQAWCIVPFDAKERTPPQRAQMLRKLGIKAFAYDFRPIHIPKFDEEVTVMKENGIDISAWWFPFSTELNDTAHKILDTIDRHGIKPELWVVRAGKPAVTPLEQQERIQAEADALRPIVVEARNRGLKVALYNHGGWFGDPENQLLVLHRLRAEGFDNVGLVYNFHHAHDQIRNFDKIWPRISPYVIAVNLNGMVPDGDRRNQKIMFVGEGTEELAMIRTIRNSGWRGRVGVVSHIVEADAAETLGRNLAGYDRLIATLRSESASPPASAKAGR